MGATVGWRTGGFLSIEARIGSGAPEWERRWCQIIIAEDAAILHIGPRHGNRPLAAGVGVAVAMPVANPEQGVAVVPLSGVLARPWPKSRREVAPFAFRLDITQAIQLGFETASGDSVPTHATKLILDPGSADERDAWMHAFAAAVAVSTPSPGQLERNRSSMSVGGLIVSVPTVSLEGPDRNEARYHVHALLATTGATVIATRTHEEFVALRANLLAIKPGVPLPALPRSRLFTAIATQPSVMEERRLQYQTFLESIVMMPAFSGERTFRAFIGL